MGVSIGELGHSICEFQLERQNGRICSLAHHAFPAQHLQDVVEKLHAFFCRRQLTCSTPLPVRRSGPAASWGGGCHGTLPPGKRLRSLARHPMSPMHSIHILQCPQCTHYNLPNAHTTMYPMHTLQCTQCTHYNVPNAHKLHTH